MNPVDFARLAVQRQAQAYLDHIAAIRAYADAMETFCAANTAGLTQDLDAYANGGAGASVGIEVSRAAHQWAQATKRLNEAQKAVQDAEDFRMVAIGSLP